MTKVDTRCQPNKVNFAVADFKMLENADEVVNHYMSLIENVEQVKSFFDVSKPRHYPVIRQHLIDCCQQIDDTITLETNHTSFLVYALCQQKQQFSILADTIQKLVERPEYQNFGDNPHLQLREDNTKQHKNDKLESIIANSMEVPKVCGLSEIIGLRDVKKVLKSLVILPRTQPQLFYDRRICNSILLYGPPGTGKTRLTHALAAEANAAFHCISASDVLSHYVGQTEKTIKTLFQNLKKSCNFSILFIDEVDALCRKRTDNEQEHTRRIKTEFMCQMSGIEECKNVIVICATNCPWDLDSAILRRLQRRIYVPPPDEMERFEFFRFLTSNAHFENLNDLTMLVKRTNGYSGSDLFDIAQTAMTAPLNELEDTNVWKCCDDGFYEPALGAQDFSDVICSELGDLPSNSVRARKAQLNDLINAVDTIKRTVTENDIRKYEHFNGN